MVGMLVELHDAVQSTGNGCLIQIYLDNPWRKSESTDVINRGIRPHLMGCRTVPTREQVMYLGEESLGIP